MKGTAMIVLAYDLAQAIQTDRLSTAQRARRARLFRRQEG
jgi:hypothetical protein